MSNTKPTALVTNDDGVESQFFTELAAALCEHFDVIVAVPKHEQSWAGRSFTRRGSVAVTNSHDPRWRGWVIDGTPSDCVNIACGRLLETLPDIVVSGINVGFNVTLPLLLTSGTVAAALEGALWGVPALALSMALPPEAFDSVKKNEGHLDERVVDVVRTAAGIAAELALAVKNRGTSSVCVHNVNFPFEVTQNTPIEMTSVGQLALGCIFAEQDAGQYRFRFPEKADQIEASPKSDMACLKRGHISHSIIDYEALGRLETPTTV